MKVFVSWSGDTSRALAIALRDWIPDVIQQAQVFMSASDLTPGGRWGQQLAIELENTDFGILCMTPENLERTWIHFEAGSLAKRVTAGRVVPLLCRVQPQDLKGPLTQFQSVMADEMGMRQLVGAINSAITGPLLPIERLERVFAHWWPKLAEAIQKIPQHEPAEPAKPRSVEDMVGELLVAVRQIQQTTPPKMSIAKIISQAREKEEFLAGQSEVNRFRLRRLFDKVSKDPLSLEAIVNDLEHYEQRANQPDPPSSGAASSGLE